VPVNGGSPTEGGGALGDRGVDGVDDPGAVLRWRSDVVDVSEVSLSDLTAEAGDSALAHSLRRLAEDLADPGEPIAGFNSAL
jgi:FXSXX-COOH protein